MATSLALSLFCLHTVGWYHKALRSASVILFVDSDRVGFETPLISAFEYARPDSADYTTSRPPYDPAWAVYSHPSYQGPAAERFRKTFDIYSLGIILLEIAHWKKADELLGFTGTTSCSPAAAQPHVNNPSQRDSLDVPLKATKEVRQRILQDDPGLLEDVRCAFGQRYYLAVKSCIEGLEELGQERLDSLTITQKNTLIQQAYLRKVVDALQGIDV